MAFEGDYYFDDVDDEGPNYFDYFDEEEMSPEMTDWLETYPDFESDSSPLEYNLISSSEMLKNCIIPTLLQMVQGLFSVLIMSVILRLVAQLRRIGATEGGVPEWMVHFASALFGIMVLHTLFRLALVYLLLCCLLDYILLVMLAARGRHLSGPATSVLTAAFLVFCELWLVQQRTWHQIRGAQMVLSMKIISLAFDYGSGAIIDLPNIFQFVGYCFHVGTVIFGPWISYEDYYKSLLKEKLPLSAGWALSCAYSGVLSVICLLHSTCFTHWIILNHNWLWFLAFRDAQSFRFSHYFVSFMSETTALLSGLGGTEKEGKIQWSLPVCKPYHVEMPRSLVEVVTNWNLPMHYWLKTYVFRATRPYGTFAAVLLTYAASSLLHGLNFQLASVLFSLGFYSYVEFVFRGKLSRIFSACIQARRCKDCNHIYTQYHPLVLVVNVAFGILSILHLAYLGLMFDSSAEEEQPSKKNPRRWKVAFLCRTGDERGRKTSKAEILKRAKEQGDVWGNEVASRVNTAISDLHAADGRYHKECYCKFYSNNASVSSSSAVQDKALNNLADQMRSDKSRTWNSIELQSQYIEFGGNKLSRRQLLNALLEIMFPDLIILSSPGVASIVVFRSKTSSHLRIEDDTDDCKERSISCLAKMIRAEVSPHDSSVYQTRITKGQIMDECSPTLLALLSAISPHLNSTMQAAMIGSIVTSAINSQATSLQLGISVMLSRQRKIVDELHTYGVTTTYDELRRFRISAAAAMASVPRGLAHFDSANGLVQIVADNFDTQIFSQNGQKRTHGLAMILTQAKIRKPECTNLLQEIPTIKRLKKTEIIGESLKLNEVTVQRYEGNKKPPMPQELCLRNVMSLSFLSKQQLSFNRISVEDFAFLKATVCESSGMCPEYGGFSTKRARESGQQLGPKTSLVYTPFLDMIPAEPDTMKTAMVEAQRLTSLTGQNWTIFTTDQQLYQVMVNITWVDKERFRNFVPRLGGMHLLMSFVGAVGFLLNGSGLEDILASTFAGVPKLLSGKKYPQNVRALCLLVEELLRPILSRSDVHTMTDVTKLLTAKSGLSKTTKLWVECLIEPVFLMMAFIRAEREADWPLHLYVVEKMLPYFFAAGHINYARYALYYIHSMQTLHPEVQKKFMAGEHVMRHQDGLWNGIWSDMFIETTYMRYGHGPSGIIGSTLNESTLAIWAFSHSILSQMISDLEAIKEDDIQSVVTHHKEEGSARMKEDAADRKKLRDALSTCVDIFDTSKHSETGMINIYTGLVVDADELNVYNAFEIGTSQLLQFEKGWPASFHDKIKKCVKNMAAVIKPSTTSRKSNSGIDSEFIYARILGIMASSKQTVSLETLFSYELASYPTSLFDERGEMRTTSKSVLKNKLQIMCTIAYLQPASVLILDASALLWTVPWPSSPAKVSSFINAAVATIMRRAEAVSVLHIVFDRYFRFSTKSCCRITRQKGNSRVFNLTEDSPLPTQALVLNVTANKEQIIKMIVHQLSSLNTQSDTRIFITGPDPLPIEVGGNIHQLPLLHEEADVLMAYHMIQEATAGQPSIRVVSDDTDVLIILAYHLYDKASTFPHDTEVTMESCTSNASIISINEVVKKHKKLMPNLLAAHALTGCDTVSSFAGVGKTTVLKKLESFDGVLKLGEPTAMKEEILASCVQFVCLLYSQEAGTDLNSMRANIFRKKIAGKRHSPPKLCNLPPTLSSFELHCQRAHHQVLLWKAALLSSPPLLDPLQFGWEMSGRVLRPMPMLHGQLPAPDEVLNLVSCSCKTGCSTAHCTCTKLLLACTTFCKCEGSSFCCNPMTDTDGTD